MILFIDGIGILLPDCLKGKPERECTLTPVRSTSPFH